MFFKYCSDNVARVGQASTPAFCPILVKFNHDESKQMSIVRVVKKRYFQSRTYKKRQLFIQMMTGPMMNQKELFDKYFKLDFMSLVSDSVDNVRITLAKALKHHYLKEISGAYVYDQEMNDLVRVLKMDRCFDVQLTVSEIEPIPTQENVTLDSFLAMIESKKIAMNWSDSDSSYSEEEQRIEHEMRRHNSEDEIDHGPVLKSLRKAREQELIAEFEQKKI